MLKKPGKPKKTVVDGDEYFYRDQEMMRPTIESEVQGKKEEKKGLQRGKKGDILREKRAFKGDFHEAYAFDSDIQ